MPENTVGAEAATVHKFQGGERDFVIYDTTESAPLKPTSWFADSTLGSEGSRLANVAASRARHQLVVLADMGTLQPVIASGSPLERLLNVEVHGGDLLAWEDLAMATGRNIDPWFGPDFLGHFNEDLASARGPSEIWSARVDLDTLESLERALKTAGRRGSLTLWSATQHAPQVRDALLALHRRAPEHPHTDRAPHRAGSRRGAKTSARSGIQLRMVNRLIGTHAVIGNIVWATNGNFLAPTDDMITMRRVSPAMASALRSIAGRPDPHHAATEASDGQVKLCRQCGNPSPPTSSRAGTAGDGLKASAWCAGWPAEPRPADGSRATPGA